ncbi:MAG: CoA transferase subunit A [Dehalococcoidia bacterium]
MPVNKIYESAEEALSVVFNGATILVSGFGPPGVPVHLLTALMKLGVKDLTTVSNTARSASLEEPLDCGWLVANGQARRVITSFPVPGSPNVVSYAEAAWREGKLEVEVVPQGTLAERIRAGGAGIGAFYTPTGVGTRFEESKEKRVINGREYVLEHPIRGDFALIHAYKADTFGNLVFRRSARNYGPIMATAADVTIVEVEEIVEPGEIDPDQVHTPGIFVHRIVKVPRKERPTK